MPPEDEGAVLSGMAQQLRQARDEVEQLKAALLSRQMIGVAQGMLMLRYGLSLDRTFEYLSRRSQDENVKLRVVAESVIDDLTADGWPER